jgi:hypothetical protein
VGKRGNQDAYRMSMPTATIGIRGTRFVAQFVPQRTTALSGFSGSHVPYALPLLASADISWLESPATLTDEPNSWQSLGLAMGTAPDPNRSGCSDESPGAAPDCQLAPGAYVSVIDGIVLMFNQGGKTQLGAGEIGFTPNFTVPPVILPQNPGVVFNPPLAFNPQQSGSETVQSAKQANQPPAGQQQDGCEVR